MNDTAKERESPWFMNKEASEIAIKCFSMRKKEIIQDFQWKTGEPTTLADVAQTIVDLNRFLYGPLYQTHIPEDNSYQKQYLDPAAILKVFYVILINECFFKECMRQYHVMNIRESRKLEISSQFQLSRIENMVILIYIGIKIGTYG
jgi:hypothetical protein